MRIDQYIALVILFSISSFAADQLPFDGNAVNAQLAATGTKILYRKTLLKNSNSQEIQGKSRRYVKINVIAFKSSDSQFNLFKDSVDEHKILKDIEQFDDIYKDCEIQIAPLVPLFVLSSDHFDPTLPALPINGGCQECEFAQSFYPWGKIQLAFATRTIPVIYPVRIPFLSGLAINYAKRQPSDPSVQALFAPFGAYISASSDGFPGILAHELGHILFNEGHSTNPMNIMADGLSKKGKQVTPSQCERARRFIDTFDLF